MQEFRELGVRIELVTIITISRYCAERIEEFYGVPGAIVVPELIDLVSWQKILAENPAPSANNRFTVLCVCRFYPESEWNCCYKPPRYSPGVQSLNCRCGS